MAITIIQPKPVPQYTDQRSALIKSNPDSDSDASESDSEAGGVDVQDDIALAIKAESRRPARRARYGSDIVTPGEVITDDPQWMRFVSLFFPSQISLSTKFIRNY